MNTRQLIFLFLLLNMLPIKVQAQLNDPTANNSLDSLLFKNPEFNGAILIMHKDSVAGMRVQGIADEKRNPLKVSSPFNLASLAKHFTGLSIAKLLDENQLAYEDPISLHLPEMRHSRYQDIKVSHLIHHTSGLPDYEILFNSHPTYAEPYGSNKALLQIFEDHHPELLFEPGMKQEYSNTGYILLASIVENISGMRFGEFLDERFFKPLGMENSFGYSHAYTNKHPSRVKGMVISGEEIALHDLTELDGVIGDGNIYASIEDFVKWDRYLNSSDFLSEEMREKYFSPGPDLPDDAMMYGFGWVFPSGKKAMQHAGGWVGFSTFYYRNPETGNSLVVLTNNSMEEEAFMKILSGAMGLLKKT